MKSDMAWAVFNRECNWSRPKSVYSFNAKASAEPQQRPRDFIEHCVSRGWATAAPSPNKHDVPAGVDAGIVKRARKGRSRAK